MERLPIERKESATDALLESSDIAVNPETGLAMVVIKPDAFRNRDAIIQRLEHSGLYVVSEKQGSLPEGFVLGAMYPDLSEGLKEQTVRHFNEGPADVLLVRGGADLVEILVALTGDHTNPARCDQDSIRYVFGDHVAREAGEGELYYRNAVHRGKDAQEQQEDLEKFRDLI